MDVRNHGRCHGDATLQYKPARLPMLAAASKPGKTTEEGVREGGGGETRGQTRVEGSAAGSSRMLIILSRWFVLHYAGDNAQDNNRGR